MTAGINYFVGQTCEIYIESTCKLGLNCSSFEENICHSGKMMPSNQNCHVSCGSTVNQLFTDGEVI